MRNALSAVLSLVYVIGMFYAFWTGSGALIGLYVLMNLYLLCNVKRVKRSALYGLLK